MGKMQRSLKLGKGVKVVSTVIQGVKYLFSNNGDVIQPTRI
jgi:hypothetical protein